MKKFIKVSIGILVVFSVFFISNNVVYKDMIHKEDYKETNQMESNIAFHSKEKVDKGTIFKFKIRNLSKYKYKLDDAKMVFTSFTNNKDGEREDSGSDIYISLYRDYNSQNSYEKSVNENIRWKGIVPNGEGYIEFLVPNGFNLDNKYFDLYSVNINLEGRFVVDIPFLDGGYITIREDNYTWGSFNYESHNKN